MISRLAVFPLVKKNGWIFRASITNNSNIMIMAFGKNDEYFVRFFLSDELARKWVDSVSE